METLSLVTESLCYVFTFLGGFSELQGQHMEVSRPGIASELQLRAYTTVMQDSNHVCVTFTTAHSDARSFKPLSKARDQIDVLMDTSRFRYH